MLTAHSIVARPTILTAQTIVALFHAIGIPARLAFGTMHCSQLRGTFSWRAKGARLALCDVGKVINGARFAIRLPLQFVVLPRNAPHAIRDAVLALGITNWALFARFDPGYILELTRFALGTECHSAVCFVYHLVPTWTR
jgi:hypothetical protein